MNNIRLATTEDADSILDIYRPYVVETAISFEAEGPTIDDMKGRIAKTLSLFPWLISEEDGVITGYAYAGPHRSRCAYSWSVESTVYLRRGCQGKGIGKKLYGELINRLKTQGAFNILGVIALPNEASVGLHESFGFKKIAEFKDIGFKLGKWWDVGYWQLQLQKPLKPEALLRYV